MKLAQAVYHALPYRAQIWRGIAVPSGFSNFHRALGPATMAQTLRLRAKVGSPRDF